jgi:hypothetical protein
VKAKESVSTSGTFPHRNSTEKERLFWQPFFHGFMKKSKKAFSNSGG